MLGYGILVDLIVLIVVIVVIIFLLKFVLAAFMLGGMYSDIMFAPQIETPQLTHVYY